MIEHESTSSKTLLHSDNIVTEYESSSSEGASEGDTNKHNGYDADEELPMSDQEGVKSSKLSPHGTHTHTWEQVHERLQPHADDGQRLTVDSPQADLLEWHYQLGHFSFKFIKAMAEVGLLLKNMAKALIPKCTG